MQLNWCWLKKKKEIKKKCLAIQTDIRNLDGKSMWPESTGITLKLKSGIWEINLLHYTGWYYIKIKEWDMRNKYNWSKWIYVWTGRYC